MRILLPAILFPVACVSLSAQHTGQITGKITTKDGKPIPNATIVLKRVDLDWSKTLVTNEDGVYMQVGLEPKMYDFSISAEGYAPMAPVRLKIPLGDRLTQNATLLTPKEAAAVVGATLKDPAMEAANAGANAFNAGVALFNSQPPEFVEALPHFETAYTSLQESLQKSTDEAANAETRKQIVTVERVYGITLFEVGKTDAARKAELWTKAEPFLTRALERAPKDQRLLAYLVDYCKFKGNAEGAKKYQATLDEMIGPRPELAYNEAVEAFNAGKMPEAKEALDRAIQTDPKFAKSYYLLGMVEYGLNNLKGTKSAFLKYLELAPNGDKSGEVKAMLADPSLKNIK